MENFVSYQMIKYFSSGHFPLHCVSNSCIKDLKTMFTNILSANIFGEGFCRQIDFERGFQQLGCFVVVSQISCSRAMIIYRMAKLKSAESL